MTIDRCRRVSPVDDRGSLPMAMLVVLVGAALAALMIPLVMTQTKTTTFDTGRGRALQAAESGIDIALGQVRAAESPNNDGVIIGDTTKLPCGPISGEVGHGSGDEYAVNIAYYTKDPTGQSDAWLADDANKMICVPGYGTHLRNSTIYVPNYVRLTTTGTSSVEGTSRTLSTTYVVQTNNSNIPGGPIRIWPESGKPTYCMDAGDPMAVGNTVTLSKCPTGNQSLPESMSFIYNADLTIQLAMSVGDAALNPNGNGLCVASSGGDGSAIKLATCADHGEPAPWQQVWSVDDSSHFRGSNHDKTDVSGKCINVANQSTGTSLLLQGCSGGTTDTHQTWIPTPAVGAGQAGATNSQLVNFQQFGRCLDVTNQRVTGADSGATFLILYACKQNPNPDKVAWNQKFRPDPELITTSGPSANQWITTKGGVDYCLTSPGQGYDASAAVADRVGYVTVTKCTSSAHQIWTTYQTQDGAGNELAYKDKFTIRDADGRCLSLSAYDDVYNGQYQKAVVEMCKGSAEGSARGSAQQKWNADANVQESVLEDLHEK